MRGSDLFQKSLGLDINDVIDSGTVQPVSRHPGSNLQFPGSTRSLEPEAFVTGMEEACGLCTR